MTVVLSAAKQGIVILSERSESKDLLFAGRYEQVLRCAQDDILE